MDLHDPSKAVNDPQFKKLNPVVQEILQAARKSAQASKLQAEKFGRLTFAQHS